MDQEPGAGGGLEVAPGVCVPPGALAFTFTASGGPGGQNVNKRATRAELRVALAAIPLEDGARARLRRLAGRRLNDAGELVLTSDQFRSQERNRGACLERLADLVRRSLVAPRPRRRTRPSRTSVERRLEGKRRRARVKQRRRSTDD